MNTTEIQNAARRIQLKLEDAPAFGSGTMPAEKEPLFAMLSHIFPLIVWFWKRSESPTVNAHGKEALNFGITAFLIVWPVAFIAGLLGVTVAKIISPILMLVNLVVLGLVIFGAIQARKGKLLRYPVNFRLIR